MVQILPFPRPQYTDGNGDPLVGGSVGYYQPGSSGTVLLPVFADEAETIPLQNPVPLDSAGITFSGGSQVTVWGSGKYEIFVRDANGVLMYSSIIDTVESFAGDLQGPITIEGDLTVTGTGTFGHVNTAGANITDLAVTGLNATQIATGGLTTSGNAGIGGNLNVAGSEGISGNLGVSGATNTSGLANTGNLHTDTLSATSGAFGSITTGSINVTGGAAAVQFRAGAAITDVGGTATVAISPAFSSVTAILLQFISGLSNDSILTLGAVTASSFIVNSWRGDGVTLQGQATFYWVAIGT